MREITDIEDWIYMLNGGERLQWIVILAAIAFMLTATVLIKLCVRFIQSNVDKSMKCKREMEYLRWWQFAYVWSVFHHYHYNVEYKNELFHLSFGHCFIFLWNSVGGHSNHFGEGKKLFRNDDI